VSSRLTLPVGERDHIQGSFEAPIILVEYGDYECPICGAAYVTVKQLQQELGDRLGFVFRNFPLSQMHPHAKDAAQAAEAAGARSRFWEMHDILFESPDEISLEDIARHAQQLGLDAARLLGEIESGTYAARVQEDFRSGVRSGVNGTPTFFNNGTRYEGPHDLESMLAALA
jgi:protein-disulfide isomerase